MADPEQTSDLGGLMHADPLTVVRDTNGEVVAFADESHVWFMPVIEALEVDHPRRRFAAMLALTGALMQTEPDAEPYDPRVAAFYARYILIPDTTYILFRERESDAELAQRFNVPLEQIAAKASDLASLDWEAA